MKTGGKIKWSLLIFFRRSIFNVATGMNGKEDFSMNYKSLKKNIEQVERHISTEFERWKDISFFEIRFNLNFYVP